MEAGAADAGPSFDGSTAAMEVIPSLDGPVATGDVAGAPPASDSVAAPPKRATGGCAGGTGGDAPRSLGSLWLAVAVAVALCRRRRLVRERPGMGNSQRQRLSVG